MNARLTKTLDLYPHFPIQDSLVLLGYRGSIAHGTYLPKNDPAHIDDKDVMGISIPPRDCYLGLRKFEGWERQEDEWDVVIYEFRKMIRLLLKSNPNVLCLLWLEPNHYILRTEIGNALIDHRHIFASREIYKSFLGYAHGQMARMTKFKFEGYMGQKRKALVEQYGYDCKNASHLIRILRQGIEFLATGELNVLRHDSRELIAIKHGDWSLEEVKTEARRLFSKAEDALPLSPLPIKPDYEAANKLCTEVLSERFLMEPQHTDTTHWFQNPIK